MNFLHSRTRAGLVLAGALLASTLAVGAGDVFDFIPAGGRTLLARVLATHVGTRHGL